MKSIGLACGVGAAVAAVGCALAPFPAVAAASAPTATVVWNGQGKGWTNPTTSTIGPESTDVHDGARALQFSFRGDGRWLGAGWDWLGFKYGPYGTDISHMCYLTFWEKSTGTVGDLQINLLCNGAVADTPAHHTDKVSLSTYCPNAQDGAWHPVKIPLSALKQPAGFDPKHVCQIQLGVAANHPIDGSYILDDIAFEK